MYIYVITIIIVILFVFIIRLYPKKTKLENNYLADKYPKKLLHQKLYTMIKLLDEYFTKAKIDYIVTGGTLLGTIREGKIIDHDDDIDIIIFDDKIFSVLEILNDLSKDGNYKFFKVGFGYKFVDLSTYIEGKDNGAQVDIFLYFRNPYKIRGLLETCKAWPNDCEFDNNIIFPIKRKKLLNFNVNIPNKSELFLTQSYGNWKEPVIYNHDRFI
jgi:phosphorylcholine metabolism protein LicD